jgi:hypothetical protein
MRLANKSRNRRRRTTATPGAWTPEAVRRLGLTTDVETAGSILGIGRTKAYEMAKTGNFPVPLLRAGRRYLVPVHALLRVLGATEDPIDIGG